jgi:hypothetical protein
MHHGAFQLLALARAAGAVLAAIGQANALADGRGRMASSGLAVKLRPLGCTVIWNVILWVSSGLFSLTAPDFALKPKPPRRPAGPLSPPTAC